MAKSKSKAGKISIDGLRTLINKTSGVNVAHNLKEANPTEVKEWIPTGSRWLDSIVCRGQLGGIPVGKFTEIAGLESTGKSFMAAQCAANAQKMGMTVVYMDSESAIDPGFLERTGCNLDDLIYVQAQSVEHVLETVESVLKFGHRTNPVYLGFAGSDSYRLRCGGGLQSSVHDGNEGTHSLKGNV